MLVLSRKRGETIDITIGDKAIEVIILSVSAGQVRLGIDADKDVKINRREISDRINSERNNTKTEDRE